MYEAQYRWAKAHPDRVKELLKRWRETHREERKKYQQEWYLKRKNDPEFINKLRESRKKYEKSHPVKFRAIKRQIERELYLKYPEKFRARRLLREAIKRGVIRRLPCEICGENKSQAHHHDYNKPFEVKWLCKKHHLEAHDGRWNKSI